MGILRRRHAQRDGGRGSGFLPNLEGVMDTLSKKIFRFGPVPQRASLPMGLPRAFLAAAFLLALIFSLPLWHLARFAWSHDLYSHILLIPLISAYLFRQRIDCLPSPSQPAHRWTATAFFAGMALLGGFLASPSLAESDGLAWTTGAFLCFLFGLGFWFLGWKGMRAEAFPFLFLLFLIPLPTSLEKLIETFLQESSAMAAYAFFKLCGTSVFNEGVAFTLPGFNLEVAPECSGMHSSFVLLIAGVLASEMFLQTWWKRILLVLLVIPLGILRNAIRILVIGELCVHVSPDMIHSRIHHQGGPLFFMLALIPFLFLLRLLSKSEPHTLNP